MLADMIVEEEFELKEEEPWYDKQDLERDLHLAAELGKTLLDRNNELEQGLQQMYSTNQEQLQEIEYLTKQVDLLRQMNEQHAKVYEQLDVVARDLEQGNQKLAKENRAAQQKIHGLTQTVDGLQMHVDGLQKQLDELKSAQVEYGRRELVEHRRSLGAQSVSCLKELYDLQHDRFPTYESLRAVRPRSTAEAGSPLPDESASLHRSLQSLQTQLALERGRREEAERETELTARENRVLERHLAGLHGCQGRQRELEAEVEELRQMWRTETAGARRAERLLLPDAVFFPPEDPAPPEEEEERRRRRLQRCSSESVLRGATAEEIRRGHELTCVRRTEALRHRGVSLLNEVDAQYSALQLKYEELLRRCHQGAEQLSHKAVQTPAGPQAPNPRRRLSSSGPSAAPIPEGGAQPEYKALFQEIFVCIQRSRQDLENQSRPGEAL